MRADHDASLPKSEHLLVSRMPGNTQYTLVTFCHRVV